MPAEKMGTLNESSVNAGEKKMQVKHSVGPAQKFPQRAFAKTVDLKPWRGLDDVSQNCPLGLGFLDIDIMVQKYVSCPRTNLYSTSRCPI